MPRLREQGAVRVPMKMIKGGNSDQEFLSVEITNRWTRSRIYNKIQSPVCLMIYAGKDGREKSAVVIFAFIDISIVEEKYGDIRIRASS
jgi:hypothetical protein